MSITPVSLLPRLKKILTKNNYEKYKFFEQVGLRPFVADAGELALERFHSFFITIIWNLTRSFIAKSLTTT